MAKFFEGKTGLLYAGLIGLVASDIIPGWGDFFFIKFQRKLRDRWAKGEISSKEYWRKELGNYYLLNSGYWLIVGTAVYFTPKYENKIKVGLALIGAGAVTAIIYKNIVKDQEEQLAEKNALKQKLINKLDGQEITDGIKDIKDGKV